MQIGKITQPQTFTGGKIIFNKGNKENYTPMEMDIRRYNIGKKFGITNKDEVCLVSRTGSDNYDYKCEKIGWIGSNYDKAIKLAKILEKHPGEHILDLRYEEPIVKFEGDKKAYCVKTIGNNLIVKDGEVANWTIDA